MPAKKRKEKLARDIMTRRLITVKGDDSIRSVTWRLIRHAITGAPVVDEAGRLLGMISQTDLAVVLWNDYGAAPGAVAEPRARDVMTRRVLSASELTPVSRLAHAMIKYKVHRLPIVRGRKLVGIVTTLDLVRLRAKGER